MLKAAIKHAATEDQVRHRMLPVEVVRQWSDKLVELKDEVSEVLHEEREEKQIRQVEMELKKGQNVIDHQDEIFSRPARTWFQSKKDKQSAQGEYFHQTTEDYVLHLLPAKSRHEHETGTKTLTKQTKADPAAKVIFLHTIFSLLLTIHQLKRDKLSGLSRKAKRRKLAMEADKELGDSKSINAAIRSAKKASRLGKTGLPERVKPKEAKTPKYDKSSFDQELARGGAKPKRHSRPKQKANTRRK